MVAKSWGRAISGPVLAIVGLALSAVSLVPLESSEATTVLRWGAYVTLGAAFLLIFAAHFDVWREENGFRVQAELEVKHSHSQADIKGWIYAASPILIHSDDGKTFTRVVVSAHIVNESPYVSPTISDFVCEIPMDGVMTAFRYEEDLGNEYETTHRDKDGRPLGPLISLAYFNHSGLVKHHRRKGWLRFEIPGELYDVGANGILRLTVVDGGDNVHIIGEVNWPYILAVRQ